VSVETLIKKDTTGQRAGLNEIIILIYGDKKVGKSTVAAQFPKPLFLDCEDGLRTVTNANGKRPDHITISGWKDLIDATQWLLKNDHGYETIVVDGLSEAWSYLVGFLLDKYKVEHMNEGQLAYGKGKGLAQRMFRQWFQALRKLDTGIVLCAHDKIIPFEHNGVSYDKRIPLIDDGKNGEAWDAIKPAVNMVLYASKQTGKDGVKHVMRTKGTQLVEAADPYGNLPEVMEFDYSKLVEAMTNTSNTGE
jgi:hypothetical protein